MVIGSGPIVIGQAAEFDYAGTQACRALREEGHTTVLVNSNPATIMTDPHVADRTYVEPLTADFLQLVIQRERPDALLAGLGGQTGLNLAVELADKGVLEDYDVTVLGTPIESIRTAEDRELFKNLLQHIGEPVTDSVVAHSVADAEAFADQIGLPLIIRPAFTLGGTGGGTAFTREQLRQVTQSGLDASPVHQVLVERSLLGWKEIEYEVMRDAADTCITICNMENFDPMGVHTGDSIVVAPSQTLSDQEYQMLRSAALRIIRALGVIGGCNVQFALDPRSRQYAVIEVNPRVSRSSALASKATGYPIARVTAKIAVGKRLHEIPNAVTQKTTAAFEPALDYLVVKVPRWPFDKFPDGDRRLGTQMKSTGEAMAIDRGFEAALQKAVRSLELRNRDLLWEDPTWSAADLERLIREPNDQRLWALMAALRRGLEPAVLSDWSGIDEFFLRKLLNIVSCERELLTASQLTPALARRAKRLGFSDRQMGTLLDEMPDRIRDRRRDWNIRPTYKMVDTCAAEFEAVTPYFYGTFESENEAPALDGSRVVVLGSGPIRIGQGIEFDYCSVRAAMSLRDHDVKSIMINSNPETVSTDFDASSRLYFEPLDDESVRDVLENETTSDGQSPAILAQFGGQTAINLAEPLVHAGYALLGSDLHAIDLAEDRDLFSDLLDHLGIPQPPGGIVATPEEATRLADQLGYPVLVRPSFVLGGRAMEICRTPEELRQFAAVAKEVSGKKPLLVDKYLEGAEIEVDAICDGTDALIPGIMEHVERAGVHSGDSIALYPAQSLSPDHIDTLVQYTTDLGRAIGVRGLFNIQYVVFEGAVYVIEVNPRGSRTVPFLSKVTGVPMVDLAVRVGLGARLAECGFGTGLWPTQPLVAAKAPVFSMSKLSQVDTYLGPEMKSTGEVMGLGSSVNEALGKALLAAGSGLARPGSAVLLSLADRDKREAMPLLQRLCELGYDLLATEGTARAIRDALGLPVDTVTKKLSEGHPNVLDAIASGRVSAVVNTVTGDRRPLRDGFLIRRAAVERRIPCFTSLDTLRAAIDGLALTTQRAVQTVDEYRGATESAQSDHLRSGTPVPTGHIVGVGRDELRPARVAPRSGFHS
ncbi:MAG: carbamoyl-phosphate synthase large subunit [Chloroflexi bacterium]|nr:carbamoyl-phosphate synthase large subunit [Chloroflexota bacterium]MBV9598298.1 carbamoyl-phosphate synthase large subunit [Chloroflexota bacterium]